MFYSLVDQIGTIFEWFSANFNFLYMLEDLLASFSNYIEE
jgi:hypothetical protein